MMKKPFLVLVLLSFTLIISCKKKYNCYVQDKNAKIIDTIRCDCNQNTITELENTPYVIKDTVYTISCQTEK
jgi:hypothetical protein